MLFGLRVFEEQSCGCDICVLCSRSYTYTMMSGFAFAYATVPTGTMFETIIYLKKRI